MNELHRAAQKLFRVAIAAADPAFALRRAIQDHPFPDPKGDLHLIAIGKAAPAMMNEALKHVRSDVHALAVTHYDNELEVPNATLMKTAHPVPDEAGLAAGCEIQTRLADLSAEDAVIVLVSGGGSALAPAPVDGVTLAEKAEVNALLLGAGLGIVEMNLVRQNLSQLKGGGLLRAAAPAPVQSYLLSDVIGDDLRAIASGPTVGPIGGPAEAMALLKSTGLWNKVAGTVRNHLSNAQDAADLPPVANHLIGSNRKSLDAMKAASEGFEARIVSDTLEGDVGEAAKFVLNAAQSAPKNRPVALIFGGETTVKLTGTGRGGRNQELALRVSMFADEYELGSNWVFLSGGTDGRDGPTDAAGGLVDAETSQNIGPEVWALLANNDSYEALHRADALLVTGVTGTNVADVQVFLQQPD